MAAPGGSFWALRSWLSDNLYVESSDIAKAGYKMNVCYQ